MPFVHIRLAGPTLAPEQIRGLQEDATRLMADVLGKKPELTAVLVEGAPISGWSIGGGLVPVAAHLTATITAGTNSEAELARFNAEAHGLLRTVLGAELPLATYVVVDQVPAEAWGYGGLTQLARRRETGPTQA